MANEFPTPAFGGAKYLKYRQVAKDYREITDFAKFEDGGVDTNEHASDAPQRYEFVYDGLTAAQANVFVAHFNTNRLSATFTLAEPRDDPWTGTTGSSVTVCYEAF